MSEAIKCDRCGDCEEAKPGQVDLTIETTTKVSADGTRESDGFGHDLCYQCARELTGWMEELPNGRARAA
jgi:CO dehydrogenase/acetyl-CoA synthase alpha subunit